MSVNFYLQQNNLATDPDEHTAVVVSAGTVEQEGVIQRMIERGSTVTEADILAVLHDYHAAIESLALDGFKVLTPGVNYFTCIKGVFKGQSDSFDPSRHRVEPSTRPGKQYRRTIRERARVRKVEASKPAPNPLTYTDFGSQQSNSVITPGGMAQIVGHRLKFDAADPGQGIFFTAEDGTATRVDMLGKNNPAELMFLTPASLAPGDYTLAVRAAFGKSTREGQLDVALTVN
jgi:hypothetical protein